METGNMPEKHDLTQGSITKKLILFALPIIAGNIAMQLYNVVDSVVVGQFVGSDALAAVQVGFPIMMLFNALLMGLAMGASILISQYRGAGDYDKLEKAVNTTFSLSIIIGVVITILGLALTRWMLTSLGTPANILDDAVVYLMIVFGGTLGSVFFYLSDGLARGLGDSRWPLYAMIISSVLNIVLDLVFVIQFGWGVAGVAIATMISYFVSGILLMMRFVTGKYGMRLSLSGMLKMDRHITSLIFKLGIPSSIQSVAMSVGVVIIQYYSNFFGSNYIAANAIIMRVDGFAVMPMFGIGAAVTTFVGQNIGANNPERAKKGIYKSIQVTIYFAAIIGVILYFFGIYLMRAFTGNQTVLDMGQNGLRFLAFCYVFMGINQCVSGAMRGAGAATAAAVTSIASSFIRIPFAYVLSVLPFDRDIADAVTAGTYATAELAKAAGVGLSHYMGLFYSMGISMACGAAMILVYFIFGKWHTKGVTDQARTG